jgi:hypothetical protein
MRYRLGGTLPAALTLAATLAASALGQDDSAAVSLFDGHSLEGWTRVHTDGYTVREGVIVNSAGSGWLRYNKPFKDFELQADYRATRTGAASGLLFRASPETSSKAPYWPSRGYQLQIIDAPTNGALLGFGVVPPRFSRKTHLLKEVMKGPGRWQTITLKVVGRHAEAALNGKTITVCDSIALAEGSIGLHGENGHFEWRNLKIKELGDR